MEQKEFDFSEVYYFVTQGKLQGAFRVDLLENRFDSIQPTTFRPHFDHISRLN